MILKNATICDESKFQISDIQIKDDIIVKIDSDIKENDEIIDCRDKIVMPQFIDLNIFPKIFGKYSKNRFLICRMISDLTLINLNKR